jgi:AP-3 complex subunit mu
VQLLDEMMDNGFPFTTEPSILKSMIIPPTVFTRVMQACSFSLARLASESAT